MQSISTLELLPSISLHQPIWQHIFLPKCLLKQQLLSEWVSWLPRKLCSRHWSSRYHRWMLAAINQREKKYMYWFMAAERPQVHWQFNWQKRMWWNFISAADRIFSFADNYNSNILDNSAGVEVITTASPKQKEYLLSLGADYVFDYVGLALICICFLLS